MRTALTSVTTAFTSNQILEKSQTESGFCTCKNHWRKEEFLMMLKTFSKPAIKWTVAAILCATLSAGALVNAAATTATA